MFLNNKLVVAMGVVLVSTFALQACNDAADAGADVVQVEVVDAAAETVAVEAEAAAVEAEAVAAEAEVEAVAAEAEVEATAVEVDIVTPDAS